MSIKTKFAIFAILLFMGIQVVAILSRSEIRAGELLAYLAYGMIAGHIWGGLE